MLSPTELAGNSFFRIARGEEMSQSSLPGDRLSPSSLSDLFRSYLQQQTAAQAEGLGMPEAGDEVYPYEAAPVQPADPALAWREGLAVLKLFAVSPTCGQWAPPSSWSQLVGELDPAVDLPFSLGSFPQLVRSVYPLLSGDSQPSLRRPRVTPALGEELTEWAAGLPAGPDRLLAAAILRLAGYLEAAHKLLPEQSSLPAEWQALRANEEAALLWQTGECGQALAIWLEAEESVPVLFNRGMALLFVGRPQEARDHLARAAAQLPETSSWHHLAQLYLTLVAARLEG